MNKHHVNRILITIIGLFAAFAISSCSAASPQTSLAPATTAPETTGASADGVLTEDDLALDTGTAVYPIFGEAAGLLAELGDAASFSEAPSCLFEGMDKTYEYDGLIIYTITQNKIDRIDGIDLISDRFSTRRGITVGASRADVLAAYGDPFDGEYDLIYVTDPAQDGASARITFIMNEGVVEAVSIYSGSNNATP